MAQDVPMRHVFAGVSYFLACYAVVVALLMLFPALVLYLPGLM
jgi:TRAP-type C4-dicarboxylate transport system permease large subunit